MDGFQAGSRPRWDGLGPATAEGGYLRRLSVLTWAGIAGFILSLAIMHQRSSLDPAGHFVSDYARGGDGWIMTLGILSATAGWTATAAGIWHTTVTGTGRLVARMLGVFAGTGLVLAVFETDLGADGTSISGAFHTAGAVLGILAMSTAIIASAIGFRREPLWRSHRRSTFLFGIPVVLCFALITLTGGPDGGGFLQRLGYAFLCVWHAGIAATLWRLGSQAAPGIRRTSVG